MRSFTKTLFVLSIAACTGCSSQAKATKKASRINVKETKTKVTYTFHLDQKYKKVYVSYANLWKDTWTIYKPSVREIINDKTFKLTLYKKNKIPYKYEYDGSEAKGSSLVNRKYKYTLKYKTMTSQSFNPNKKTPIFAMLGDYKNNNKISFNDIEYDTHFDAKDQGCIVYIRFAK